MRTNTNIWKECVACEGECCKWETVFLSFGEVKKIKRKTRRNDFYFKKGKFFRLKKEKDGYCVFYNKINHRCSIYDARPFDCHLFPFDIIKKNGKFFWIIWTFCPVVKKREIYPETFTQFIEFLEVFEKTIIKEFEKHIDDYANYSDEIMHSKHSFRVLRGLNIQ